VKQRILGVALCRFLAVALALGAIARMHGIVYLTDAPRLAQTVLMAALAAALSGVIRDWPGDHQ
jgi:hypothetical protein